MAHALSQVGSLQLRAWSPQAYLIPLRLGSRHQAGRRYIKDSPASNAYGPINYKKALRQPVLHVVAHLQPCWFTYSNLASFFSRDQFGQLASLGAVQWRHGGETPVCYAAAKVASMTLLWEGPGKPVLAGLDIRPYGRRMLPSPAQPSPYFGGLYDAKGITYGGLLSAVTSGMLTIDNKLKLDRSSPRDLFSIDGDEYPTDYRSDFPEFGASITQYTYGQTLDTDDSRQQAQPSFSFVGPTGSGIRLTITATPPDRIETTTEGHAETTRIYDTIVPSLYGQMFRFEAI